MSWLNGLFVAAASGPEVLDRLYFSFSSVTGVTAAASWWKLRNSSAAERFPLTALRCVWGMKQTRQRQTALWSESMLRERKIRRSSKTEEQRRCSYIYTSKYNKKTNRRAQPPSLTSSDCTFSPTIISAVVICDYISSVYSHSSSVSFSANNPWKQPNDPGWSVLIPLITTRPL